MKITVEDIKPGILNVELGMKGYEIDRIIQLLMFLKNDMDQHFHISSNFDGKCRIGDLTFYVVDDSENDDVQISGLAQGPNT